MYIKLAYKFMKKNKRLALYILTALVIAGSLFISGGTFINSYAELSIINQEQSIGSWHLKLKSESMEDAEAFVVSHKDMIEKVGREEYLYSMVWSIEEMQYTMDIVAGDEQMFQISGINVYKGRLPENDKEIVLDYSLFLDRQPVYSLYNLGDEITFSVGKRMDGDTPVYGDTDAGTLYDTETVTYTIVGFLDSGEGYYYNITSYTYKDSIEQADRYWFRMSSSNVINKIDTIISDCGLDWEFVYNSEVNGAELLKDECLAVLNGPLYERIRSNGFMGRNLIVKYGFMMLVVIIFLAGFLMIINIYQLVLNKREQDYATLYALGMEEDGVFLISFFEGFFLWFVAMFISILLSFLLNAGLMTLVKNLAFQNIRDIDLHFSLISTAIGGIATFIMMQAAIIGNFISKRRLSIQQMITGNTRYIDTRKNRSKIIPIEIRLSMGYIAKNKLKFFLMVLSLSTSLLLLYGFYCAEEELEVSKLVDGVYYADDFYVWGSDVWNISELKEEMPYAQTISEVYSVDILVPDVDLPFTPSILADEGYNPFFEDEDTLIQISFISETEYETSIKPRMITNMTYEEWSQSGTGILADWYRGSDGELYEAFVEEGPIVIDYQGSDELLTPYNGGSITCEYRVSVLNETEVNFHTGFLDLFIYLPLEKMPELFDSSTYQFLFIDAEKGYEYDLLEWLNANKDIYNFTLQDNITEKVGEENLRVIVLICLSFVCGLLLLVCIINIWNTVESNLYSRSYELGVLEELGMSNLQKFFVCMPDLFAALFLAVLIANGAAKFMITHYLTKVEGIPIWLSLGLFMIYLLLMLAVNIPTIRKMNMIRIRENE